MTALSLLLPILAVGCGEQTITQFLTPPTVGIQTPEDGAVVWEGVPFGMVGVVKDDTFSPPELTLLWLVDGEHVCTDALADATGVVTCEATFEHDGVDEVEVALVASDPDGAEASDAVTVTVLPNTAPRANILLPDPVANHYSNKFVVLEGTATDGEDEYSDLQVRWESSADGVLDVDVNPTSDGVTAGSVFLSQGEHYIVLTVTDTTGRTGQDNVTITVGTENSPPTCGIDLPAWGATFAEGQTIDFEATAADVDVANSLLTAEWESDLDGPLGTSTVSGSGRITYSTNRLTAGTHTVTLSVADEVGDLCQDTVRLAIGGAPFVTLVAPAPGAVVNEGVVSLFEAHVTDVDDNPTTLAMSWESTVDGVFSSQPADSSGVSTFSWAGLSRGNHTLTVTATDPGGLSGSASTSVLVNGLPTAPVIELTPVPATSSDDLRVNIVADGVDPEGDAVTYTYAWTKDGSATSLTGASVLAADTTRFEVWEVTVTPQDPYGVGTPAVASITVENSLPSVPKVILTPDPAVVDSLFTCVPSGGTDADGDTVTYTYTWWVNAVQVDSTGSDATWSSTTLGTGDTIQCEATPVDGYGAGTPVLSQVVRLDNSAPTIASATLTPLTAYETTTLTCSPGATSDPDGDTVTVKYDWDVNGVVLGVTSSTLTGTWFDKGDVVACLAIPNDGSIDGAAATSNKVTIRNSAPTLASVTLSPDPASELDVLQCKPATATDADGDAVTYATSWKVAGSTLSVTATSLTGADFSRGDTVQCFVVPTDGTDAGPSVSSNVVTIGNAPPSLASVAIDPSSPSASDDLTAVPSGWSDADGDAAGYAYAWYVSGALVSGVTGDTLASSHTASGDSVYVVVTPYDGRDYGSAVTSSTVVIGNSPPTVASVSLTPTTATESSTLTCTAGATADPDGDTVTIRYDWVVSGITLGVTSSTLSGTWFDKYDTVTCVVTPNDGKVDGTPKTSNTVTIGNSAPSLTAVTLSPSPATELDTLVCSPGTATDADGDAVTYAYAWTVEGSVVSVTTSTLRGSSFSKGDEVFCSVTPADGTTAGTAVKSNVVDIENAPPSATSASLSPSSPSTSDTITVSVTGWSDPDGDTEGYRYAWYVNGSLESAATGKSLGPSFTGSGDSVYCVVTPWDGTDVGTPLTTPTVTVGNTAPTLASVSLTPDPAYVTSTMTCAPIGAVDADGDTVTFTYAWAVNGVTVSGTASTLTGSSFRKGDVVECAVTPSDGTVSGSAVSSNKVTIANTAPTLTTVTLSPDPATELDTLACAPSGAADADGDSVSYTYSWKRNTTSLAVTSSTLTGSSFSKGDTVQCTATPTDGTTAGTPVGSNVVSIENAPPTLVSVSISPTSPSTSDTLAAVPSGWSDADGDSAGYQYAWKINGVTSSVTSSTLGSSHTSTGDFITVTVTPYDGTDTGPPVTSAGVTVGNTAPTVASASLTPTTAYETTTLTCTPGVTADADGDIVTIYYDWIVNGVSLGVGTSTLTGTSFSKGDSVRCEVTPNDGSVDGSPQLSSAVTISNSVPTLSVVALTPDPATEADTLVCAPGTATDADSDAITFTYLWVVNGSSITPTSPSLSSTWFERGDTVECKVTPKDATGSGTTVTSNAVTIDNTPPSLVTVSLTPSSPKVGDTLTCSPGSATDADGDTVTYTYAWKVNSVLVSGTSSTLTSGFGSGDSVFCEVTPFDGYDYGSAVASNVVSVGNTPPTITGASLSPTTAYETSTLTCAPGATSDTDGDPVTVSTSWVVNGVLLGVSTTTLTGTYFDKDDEVYCLATPSDGKSTGTAATSNKVIIKNSGPTVASVTLSPSPAYETSTLLCAPSGGVDADGDPISYTYAWSVDGVAVSSTASALTGTWFDKGEAVVCTVTATDGTTAGTPVSSTAITISNTAPSALSASVSPTTPKVGDTLVVTMSGWSDVDGDAAGYLYQWYVSGSPVSGATLSSLATGFVSGDTVYAIVTPFDGTSTGSPVTSNVVTVGNGAPSIGSVGLTPTTAYETSTLSCTVSGATDPDGDPVSLTYAWYVNGAVTGSTGTTLTGTNFSKSDTVYCRVTPDDGVNTGAAVSSNTVSVLNSTPVVATVTLTPEPAYEKSTMTCSPSGATDADGDAISYTYAWDVNGSAVAATSSTLSGTFFKKGDLVTCKVTPKDASGSGLTVDSNTVTVSNTAPTVLSATASPTSPKASDTITVTPNGWSDADGDAAGYLYQWHLNGSAVSGATSSSFAGSHTAGDTIYCVVTPYDGTDSGSPVTSNTVTSVNSTPTVSGVSLSPTTAYETSTLSCIATTTTDADGDPVTVNWAWYVNGVNIGALTSTLTGTSFDKSDVVYCTATPTDGTSTGTTVASNVVTIQNAGPSIASVSLSPNPAYETSTVSCTAVGALDPDGDSITYTYAWEVAGSTISSTGSTLGGTWFKKGDAVVCKMTPKDGSATGATVSSSTLVISNSPPSLVSASVTPTSPTTSSTLTVAPSGWYDADGDAATYRYQWYANSSAISGATTSTLTLAGYGSGDVFYCQVTPFDGTDSGTPVNSSSVGLGNTPPVVASASMSPTSATETTTFTCSSGTTSDADGDPVTVSYGWEVNGVATGTTSTTLTGTYFDRDDTVNCVVTPHDGTAYGSPVRSNQVKVSNTTPTLSGASLTPSTAYETTTLTCSDVGATDVDGDSVTSTVVWSVNSSAITAVGNTLTGTWFDRGDSVNCTMTPSDGTATGSSKSATAVVIQNSAPKVTTVTLGPSSPKTDDTIVAYMSGWSDADGDPEGYQFAWFVNSVLVASAGTDELDPVWTETGDTVYVEVTPYDGTSAGTLVKSASLVVGNTAPTVGGATLNPSLAYETSTLTCGAYDEYDADGDAITIDYGWYVNGVKLISTGSTLTGSSFRKADTVYCTATPFDGSVSGTKATSNTVTILNSTPTITAVSLTPSTAYETTVLTCSASGSSDADADSVIVNYSWNINGVNTGASGNTLTGAWFDKADIVSCQATPNDGTENGSSLTSSSVTVANTKPSALTATLTPNPAKSNDALSVIMAGWSDADGDAEQYLYEWYVNGTLTGTSSTLASTMTARNDQVYAKVTPYDGTDTGTTLTTTTVTVQNSAPSNPVISISPAAPQPTDTLTCVIVTNSVDVDGDTITYTYAWKKNGLSTSYISNTIDHSLTSSGDTWECIVTASDGLASSGSVNWSVNVNDTVAPGAPVLTALTKYSNDEAVQLGVVCEAFAAVTFYLSNSSGAWTESGVCSSSGGLAHTSYLDRGEVTSVYAIQKDSAGNSSPASNTVSTEVCDPEDEYDTDGLGDDRDHSVNEWAPLTEDGTTVIEITGNMPETSDEDWYVIYTPDDVASDRSRGYDDFNFEVTMVDGASDFALYVFRGSSSTTSECSTLVTGYDEFDFFNEDQGDAPNHTRPADRQLCKQNSSAYNDCSDYSDYWYVKVVRKGAESCASYTLEVTNGDW